MPTLLDRPDVAERSTTEELKLAAPFNPAHIDAEFREDQPTWRRALHAAGAPLRGLFEPYWSNWEPGARSGDWWPTMMGDMELPLLQPTYRLQRRCCTDEPDQY